MQDEYTLANVKVESFFSSATLPVQYKDTVE